jgi:hypothetical protein
MLNLNEAFKEEFRKIIQEETQERDLSSSLEEFEEAQKRLDEGFEIINEYFTYYANKETLKEAFQDRTKPGKEDEDEGKKKQDDGNKKEDKSISDTIGNVFNFIMRDANPSDRVSDYEPVLGHVKLEKITDMKFPENVIFFFQQLISWVVNLVKRFISFFTNAIQRFFGLKEAEKFEDEVKLNFQRAKKIESLAMPLSRNKNFEMKRNMPNAVTAIGFDINDFEKVRGLMGFNDPYALAEATTSSLDRLARPGDAGAEERESKQIKAIDINISKEMEGIHQLLQYFFDLFDNAYGSNREYLFGTEDLEMLLELFRTTIKDLTQGSISTTAIAGKMTSLDLISSAKLKDNLIRTKINTDNLKKVYVQIEEAVSNMLAILSHKQLVAVENLGISYRFYSASTYMQMIKILDAIKPRIKETEKMEKDLKKVKEIFDKIIVQLAKQRQALIAFGEVTYSSVYQRKISELFDSARYVSQTISLRLATLGLFIKQVKDIRESIQNVNAINERSKDVFKKEAFRF